MALTQIPSSSGGGAPSGAAGGDLSGTYPDPSVAKVGGTTATTIGKAIVGLTNPGAITFLRANADNTASLLSAADTRTALGLTALATTTPGTGIATALAINVGSAGAPVLFNGALGTPSSGTLTSCTGLPVSTGISGLGTGVATTLATNLSITGGGTIALGGFTATIPATGTVALRGTANEFTAAQTITVAGAVSASPLYLTGTIMSGGTGTTNFPNLFIEPTGATPGTTWSTGGTAFGINLNVNSGNFADWRLDGVTIFSFSVAGVAALSQGVLQTFATTDTVQINGIGQLTWGTTNATKLFCTTADQLDIRNSTRAQNLKVFGTYTDDSNYVRGSLAATSTSVTLAAETAGTGADNVPLKLTTAGTALVDFTNQSASADAAVVSTHTFRIKVGGTEYKVLLATP